MPLDYSYLSNYSSLPSLRFRLTRGERQELKLNYPRVSKDFKFAGATIRQAPVMGVELEVEVDNYDTCPSDIVRQCATSFEQGGDDTFAIYKPDSSLDEGFEICTVPATLAYHKSGIWDPFFEGPSEHLQGIDSPNAGIHIHINKKSFSSIAAAKFVSFLNNQNNRDFVCMVAGREDNEFWNFRSGMDKVTCINGRRLDRGVSKYSVVNIPTGDSKDTFEVRCFASTMDKATFYKNLEFVHNLRMFAYDTSLANLSHKDFIDWLYKNADNSNKYLRAFLNDKLELDQPLYTNREVVFTNR